MKHLLYVAILGAGFFGMNSIAAAEGAKTNAYLVPSVSMQNAGFTTLPLPHMGRATQYTRSLRVSDIQRQLNKLGAGLDVDGIWGPKTSAAVAEFQRANNLPISGKVDAVTFDIIINSL